ncbi:MAG: helix-turn-helix domain-containing protein [Bdellovibrionales bacterium]|nr:helix-turn-helix domain-containing protein [Bdellovibrionales bacterium]
MLLDQDTLKYIFGMKMRGLRLDKGLSLKELAEQTGMSPSYLNEIEKGKKYPKSDKIIVIAKALGESYEDLVSVKLKRELNLISQLLEKNILTGLPFELFGIPSQVVYELLSERPRKMGALIGTLLELARSHNISIDEFYYATLRAYLDLNQNFFPAIEEKVEAFREEFDLEVDGGPDRVVNQFQELLRKKFRIEVETCDFGQADPHLKHLYYCFKPKAVGGTLLIHPALGARERALILARELGFRVLEITERPFSSMIESLDSFQQLLNHFSASYFASGLLVPERQFVERLKELFSQSTFDRQAMREWILSYACPVESVFHRLTQLLPRGLGVEHLFFLRLDYSGEEDHFQVVRELHLAERHTPHKITGREHYCRRWLTTQLLEQLKDSPQEKFLVGCQLSRFRGSDTDYLAWSMAFEKDLPQGDAAAVTVGVLINKKAEDTIQYLRDPAIPIRETAETCERCEVADCAERAAAFNSKLDPQRAEKVRRAINNL